MLRVHGTGGYMSKYGNPLTSAANISLKIGPIARPLSALRYVSIQAFEARFGCRLNSLPQNVCVLGWLRQDQLWYCAPGSLAVRYASSVASQMFQGRHIEQLLNLLSVCDLIAANQSSLWFPYCFFDGWRERNVYSPRYQWVKPPDQSAALEWRGAPGEVPVLSPDRHWLAAYGAHHGDPSALLLPESYYTERNFYLDLFAEVNQMRVPWARKMVRGVLAAGDAGEASNFFTPPGDPTLHPRRLVRQTVNAQGLAIDVHLGQGLLRSTQLGYRYIVDVDGYVRTWDAWAWKMMSGSTVLSVESPWASFFSRQFSAWEHYVPVANDCSDLAAKLDWCRDHDNECEAIAERARARARVVYDRNTVFERTRSHLRQKLAAPLPQGWC